VTMQRWRQALFAAVMLLTLASEARARSPLGESRDLTILDIWLDSHQTAVAADVIKRHHRELYRLDVKGVVPFFDQPAHRVYIDVVVEKLPSRDHFPKALEGITVEVHAGAVPQQGHLT
jgi:hypothetical protein